MDQSGLFHNTEVISVKSNQMSLLKLPQLQCDYGTEIYSIDRVNRVLYAVYPDGMKKIDVRAHQDRQGKLVPPPKAFHSTLMANMAPGPQATSTPAMGVAVTTLASTLTNEKMLASVPREEQGHFEGEEVDPENLSNASISRMSVEDPLCTEEMEYKKPKEEHTR